MIGCIVCHMQVKMIGHMCGEMNDWPCYGHINNLFIGRIYGCMGFDGHIINYIPDTYGEMMVI